MEASLSLKRGLIFLQKNVQVKFERFKLKIANTDDYISQMQAIIVLIDLS